MNLLALKTLATAHHVPIISDEGLLFLKKEIESRNIKKVLEIGTAIGYSAIAMASFGCEVDTLERDEWMFEKARLHVEQYNVEDQVHVIFHDALTYEGPLRTYDLIFIDAAKAQYQKFFEKYAPFLNPNGILICDNLSFHDLKPENVNRHTKQLLRKLNQFKSFLANNKAFHTTFYDAGDGMSVSVRSKL